MCKENRLFSRLKNHFYSLYEIDQELSATQSTRKITISSYEYDELDSLKTRQIDQTNTIKTLLDEYKDSKDS